MSFPSLRKRTPSQPVVTADLSAAHFPTGVRLAPQLPQGPASGAISRIFGGLFGGTPNPAANLSAEVAVPNNKGFYLYHEGDLFTPGAQNYVFEPTRELPMQTLWGGAFIRRPNTFSVRQPQQPYSNPTITYVGVGGLVAGQIAFQPLETEGE